jgi:hypothetical protein
VDLIVLGGGMLPEPMPRDENEAFTRLTPEEQLLPIFAGLDFVVCGHTHMQFGRRGKHSGAARGGGHIGAAHSPHLVTSTRPSLSASEM